METPRSPRRLRWTFSSLGCPELDLDGVFELALGAGLECVELRAIDETVDLPAWLAKTYGTPAAFAAHVNQSGVRIASLDTSFHVIGGDDAERASLLAFMPWAEALGGVPLRVFDGGRILDAASLESAMATMAWWEHLRVTAGWKSTWIIETHDCLFTTPVITEFMRHAPESVRMLWDSHHTWKKGSESPVDTWRAIRPWVRHVHVKDSVSRPSQRHPYSYVFLGEGEFPLRPLLEVLRDDGYEGPVSLEWERMWHRDLAPLKDALSAADAGGWLI